MRPTPWTRLRAAVDPVTRKTLGLYAAYSLTSEEYIGTVKTDTFTPEGFSPERLSAAKRHPESGRLHVASLTRTPDEHPDAALGTGLVEYDPGQTQFHVHAFNTDVTGFLDVFSHYELRPTLRPVADENWGEAISRMAAHYRPTWDRPNVAREEWTYLRGVEDPVLDIG